MKGLSMFLLLAISLAGAQVHAAPDPTSHPDLITANSPRIDPRAYGAKFDNITDDSAALQRACNAAAAKYRATGAVTVVQFPRGATKVTGQVSCGSGVYLRGPATVHVPKQTGRTFLFQNANSCGAEGLTIQVDNIAPKNNWALDALVWNATAAGNYSRVRFKNNVIHNSDWGIAVISDAVGSQLSDVEISGNTIDSPQPYQNFDGIHLEGGVMNFAIVHNRITNRDDNAIGINGLDPKFGTPQHGVVADNVGLNDIVGINATGSSNLEIVNNRMVSRVVASSSNTSSKTCANPFIMLEMRGVLGANVHVIGNTFITTAGFFPGTGRNASCGYDAAVDYWSYGAPAPVSFERNTFGTVGLFLRSNGGDVTGNTFGNGAWIQFGYDGSNHTGATNWTIGENSWQGRGTIRADWADNIGLANTVARQNAARPLTYVNQPHAWRWKAPPR